MTDIIDGGTYVRATNYTGPGTIDGHCISDGGTSHHLTGYFTSSGAACVINVGFKPRVIHVTNETDSLLWFWQHGMQAANSIKTTLSGPTIALDTGSAFTISADSPVGDAGNHTLTLSSTLCGTSKNICFSIEG